MFVSKIIAVIKDRYAHVGKDSSGYSEVLGNRGYDKRNVEGSRLMVFCNRTNLAIANA